MRKENQVKDYHQFMKILQDEKATYFGSGKIRLEDIYRKSLKYQIFRYIRLLRKYEYLCYQRDCASNFLSSKIFSIRIKSCDHKKNKLGLQLGFEITPNHMGIGVKICHQNVIINGYVGDNCTFHGNNVIGNKRTGAQNEIPTLGSNVDVGVGAIVIGNVRIADDCIIGAGAVVTKSFLIPGTVIAGVPAKEIKNFKG